MIYFTLLILSINLHFCYCFQVPSKFSSIGDNAVVLCLLAAAFGTISLIGACAICFRRKKTFELEQKNGTLKLENETGSPENIKKNEFPIFRALSTEINESSAIVPCERNNLSRDNLLISSDNIDENDSLRKNECVDSSSVILIEKTPNSSQRERNQQISRDTILFETEKKYQSPSSKTPLLYAKNVQSYQEQQPIHDQIQQKSGTTIILSPANDSLNDLYDIEKQSTKQFNLVSENETKLVQRNLSINESKSCLISSNPFFSSITEDDTIKEAIRDDASEIDSSVNDASEKYQILEEETDCEEAKANESIDDLPTRLERQNSKSSNCSTGDKSIEEALRALDNAIGFDEDDDEIESIAIGSVVKVNLEEIKDEATFLVDSIVNDCEKILKQKEDAKTDKSKPLELCFEDFLTLRPEDISTPSTLKTSKKNYDIKTDNVDVSKALFTNCVNVSTNEIINNTFPVPLDENNQTIDKVNDIMYDTEPSKVPLIKIEKDRDEMNSEDLTTVTPVNTPIELSYSNETWNKMSYEKSEESIVTNPIAEEKNNSTFVLNEFNSEQIKFNRDGWYLHSNNKNDTFDLDEDDNEEVNMEDMASTFEQLKRQLTEILPNCAQGMSAHNDFIDDEDLNKDSNSPSDNYGIKYGELDEASNAGSFDLMEYILNPEPVTELNINYNNHNKRPLSPILEESECDETCRTFVLNETRLLDSTSTGVMESASGDAVMGQMPKTLMASNDTLFNFEDTLSDHTDILLSPRINTAGSSTSSTLSRQESQDRINNERTPTNEDLPKITANDTNKCQDAINILKNNILLHPLNLELNINATNNSSKYELTKLALQEDGSWPLDLPEAQQILNDLSSPEQNRTADSLSFEHEDVTYTIDDQKTCVSFVLKNDEERISEISEPLFASESLGDDDYDDKANSLIIDEAVSFDIDDSFNFEINDENGNQNVLDTEDVQKIKQGNFEHDSINIYEKSSNFEVDSLEPNEEKILKDEMEADSIPASQISKSVYNSINDTKNSVQNITNIAVNEIKKEHDSSNDNESKKERDIRQISCNQSIMSTSFSKEWSDDDSSHSSIEFMYVKGGNEHVFSKTQVKEEVNSDTRQEIEKNQKEHQNDDNLTKNEYHKWNIETMPHRKSPKLEDGESEDDTSGEEESEFIPSCWDQSLQPSKSSLKSPEKEKELSIDQEKNHAQLKTKRRVVFKIQRYHSVYEYPSEVIQLSPAYSEPQLWSNYLDDRNASVDYFTYSNQFHDISNTIDGGFNISSTSRPFHVNNLLLHNTWPNENDHNFSWSQFQDESNETRNFNEIPLKIEWPIRKTIGFDEDDSGLCENSESPSIAELNYSKDSLRLPVELISSSCSEVSDFMSTDTREEANDVKNNDCLEPNNFADDDGFTNILQNKIPTPSGSMDSLSSNSHSSSNSSPPLSFTTFGKNKTTQENDAIGKKSIIFIDDDQSVIQLEHNMNQKRGKSMEAIESIKVVIGSSDDDSGFENVKCEAK
ncbi:uro-adherence factor A-like isoform X2 [Chironomus tepperi]|uniref:uro-adherence factor A-like isoform X2 n=1 Tax=Chironomus tepperi TaxID=113505 RepID=UPI00391FC7DC